MKKLAAHQNAADETKQGPFFKQWLYSAIEWHLWRDQKEALLRGHLYATAGRLDLAKPDLMNGLLNSSNAGRKNVSNGVFARAGVSVSPDAYSGSVTHLDKVVEDYTQKVTLDWISSWLEPEIMETDE